MDGGYIVHCSIKIGDDRMDFGFMNRNERAVYFLENWHELPQWKVKQLLPDIWTSAEFPGFMAEYEEWLQIFITAGFCSDDGSKRPTETLTVYRAATTDYIYGLGWTSNLKTAHWFNDRNHLFGWKDSKIYKTIVHPGNVLAIFNDRKEDEIMIDFEGIDHVEEIKEEINSGETNN